MGRAQAVVLLALCAGCSTYRVQQSSLVPAATVPAATGDRGLLELYAEDSTVTFLSRPELAPSSDAGLYVARHQLQLAGAAHISKYLGMRGLMKHGLSVGAMAAAPTTLRNPGRGVSAWGHGWFAKLPLAGRRHRLHLAVDYQLVHVPSFVITQCVSGCEGEVASRRGLQRDVTFQSALALTYIHQPARDLDLRFTAAFQTHPTNVRDFESSRPDAEVESGPAYLTLGLGAEILLTPYFSVLPQISWPVSREPIVYGPIFGIGLRGILHDPQGGRAEELH